METFLIETVETRDICDVFSLALLLPCLHRSTLLACQGGLCRESLEGVTLTLPTPASSAAQHDLSRLPAERQCYSQPLPCKLYPVSHFSSSRNTTLDEYIKNS